MSELKIVDQKDLTTPNFILLMQDITKLYEQGYKIDMMHVSEHFHVKSVRMIKTEEVVEEKKAPEPKAAAPKSPQLSKAKPEAKVVDKK